MHLRFGAALAVVSFGAALGPVAGRPLTIVARGRGRGLSRCGARRSGRSGPWSTGATAWPSRGSGYGSAIPATSMRQRHRFVRRLSLDGPDLERPFVDADTDFAPWTAVRAPRLASRPFAVTPRLESGGTRAKSLCGNMAMPMLGLAVIALARWATPADPHQGGWPVACRQDPEWHDPGTAGEPRDLGRCQVGRSTEEVPGGAVVQGFFRSARARRRRNDAPCPRAPAFPSSAAGSAREDADIEVPGIRHGNRPGLAGG